MKKIKLIMVLFVSLLAGNGLSAQQQANYTIEEQAQLDSIKQSYLDRGIPAEWAERRAQSVFKRQNSVETRAATYTATLPPAGSIWIDRDSITGAPSASHAHAFSPDEFVKDVFVKGGRNVADQAIRNVTFRGQGWDPITETWTGPDRSLLYFDHGDPDPDVFGIRDGFLLSTMDGRRVEGPNSDNGDFSGFGFPNTGRGEFWTDVPTYAAWVAGGGVPADPATLAAENFAKDPDLGPIATAGGDTLGTLAVLEFEFRSFTDSVTFQFIFASEEFPEWSNTQFNDAFGFFVSGPGLTDEWGNSGDTINIARYPNGAPIAVNSSNWGNSGQYNPGDVPLFDAVSPQYHVPVHFGSNIMEYDGRSIVLTAKAKLQRGVWYRMKLAIGDVADQSLGSGAFLMGGSLDLGAPESEVPRPHVKTPYDSIYGWNSLYADCANSIILNFDPAALDQDVFIWSAGSGAKYVYNPDSISPTTGAPLYFVDTIRLVLPANDSTLVIPITVDSNVENGSQVWFYSRILGGFQQDTTEIFDLYAKSGTKLVRYTRPTANYAGILEFETTNGSPYIQRSLNGGLTWEFVYDPVTGEARPFTKSQIANIAENEYATILLREPNTCAGYDTLTIGGAIGLPTIMRTVTMPAITGVICDKAPGEHALPSRGNFTFVITPTGSNIGMELVVSTSRTSVPDSEGVVIVKNPDGSYTVTIRQVQEPIEIYVNFTVANAAIENDKIWTSGNQLYIQTEKEGRALIHNISGALVQTVALTAGETSNTPLARGFYLVTMNGFTHKIVIK